jgi:chemotaxis protein histidine kinase CheA
MLQRQLDAAREERSAAESLQKAEQQEAEELENRLETVGDSADEAEGLLGEVKHTLVKKSKEAHAAKEALARSVELAGDLRAAVTEAEREALIARNAAMVARRGSVIQSTRAREDLEAANAIVEEAGEAAEEVAREREVLHSQKRHAELERRSAAEAKRTYELELKKAKKARSKAEEERQKALSEKLALETKENLAFEQVVREKEEAEKQRQQHYEAAAAMKQKTEEAEAIAELASKERMAAEREKAEVTMWKRQADADKASTTIFSYISWGLMFVAGLAFLAMSVEIGSCGAVAKWESMGLRPAWLLQEAFRAFAILRCRRVDVKKDKLRLLMPPTYPALMSPCEDTLSPEVLVLPPPPRDSDEPPPLQADVAPLASDVDHDSAEQAPTTIHEVTCTSEAS